MTPARLRSIARQEITAARAAYRAMGWAEAIRGLRKVEVKVSGQLTRAAGSCTFYTGAPCLIKLSSKLLCHESVSEAEVVEVVRHEIAHAAAGLAAAHGPRWQRACDAIGSTGEQFHQMHTAHRAVRVQRVTVDVRCSSCDKSYGSLNRAGQGRIQNWLDARRSPCCRADLYGAQVS
ncbi:MAG: hypothetical protein GY772_01980 [bacterium]|nr:hypothetical protein [bacterium]